MIISGDSLEQLKRLPDHSVDACVTDPPYGLKFMNKAWDYDVPSVELWREVLRVLKPGAHLLSFGGTRTYHRLVVAIEDAGFEIRDQIQWIYGSGFPKSLDVSKAIDKALGAEHLREISHPNPSKRPNAYVGEGGWQTPQRPEFKTKPATEDAKRWQGFGTALKPANEPIVLARKPLEKGLTIAENVVKWGCGAINVDACRIGTEKIEKGRAGRGVAESTSYHNGLKPTEKKEFTEGRWPANVLFDEAAAEMLGEPSRFFYVAKASKRERNAGLDNQFHIKIETNECKDANTAAVQLLQKVISESTVRWLIAECGERITVTFPKECKSTIKTEISRTIELKTLSLLMHSLTSESTLDASELMETGLNPAESVANLRQFLLSITNEQMALALGASRAANKVLQSINENEELPAFTNFHSTVKPIKLMEYLIRLVTPRNGVVLDPFMGSGSTGVAAKRLGFQFIGVELSEEYLEIAKRRIEAVK